MLELTPVHIEHLRKHQEQIEQQLEQLANRNKASPKSVNFICQR